MQTVLDQVILKTQELYFHSIDTSKYITIDELYMLKDIWYHENRTNPITELSDFLSYVVEEIGVIFDRPRYYVQNSETISIPLGSKISSLVLAEQSTVSESDKYLNIHGVYVAIIEL